MDRADETSDPTIVPTSAPALPERGADVAVVVAVSARRGEGPEAAAGEPAVDAEAPEGASISGTAPIAQPPRPLPPRAFSSFGEKAQPPAWFLPIPPRPSPFNGSSNSVGAVPAQRSYAAPSVANTLADPTRRYGGWQAWQAEPAQSDGGKTQGREPVAPISVATEPLIEPAALRGGPDNRLMAATPSIEPRFDRLWQQPVRDRGGIPAVGGVSRPTSGTIAKRAIKIAAAVAAAWLGSILLLVVAYRFIDPPVSALMVQRWASGEDIVHEWVDIESMSPHVIRAVLLSEDGRFCEHNGVDFDAIQEAVERAGGGTPRGASTISMQVVKNLFLWPSKSYLRKAIELPLTYAMEVFWPKRRIMEVYLNIAEWGPGIFGVETASRFHFNKSARSLSEREAARLAVVLPNPMLRDAGDPGPGTQRLASIVQERMRAAPASQTACVLPRRRL